MTVLQTATYRALVDALAAIQPDEAAGGFANQVKLVLGEVADLWPAAIFDDMAGDEAPAGP